MEKKQYIADLTGEGGGLEKQKRVPSTSDLIMDGAKRKSPNLSAAAYKSKDIVVKKSEII